MFSGVTQQAFLQLTAGAAAIVIAIFFARLWPRRKHAFFGNDTWGFLLDTKEIKENNWKLPEHMKTRVLEEPFDYPPLFHYLLALLPEKNVASRVRFVSPALDAVHALLVIAATFWLTQNVAASLLAGSFFVFTAAAVSDSFTLTARPFSALLYSFLLFCLLAALHNPWFYLAAAVLFALILLGHKMAAQFSFFSLVILSLAEWSAAYALVLAGGFVLAAVASGGFYFKILKSHVAILDFWRRNISKRRTLGFAGWLAFSLAKIVFNPWVFFAAAFYVTTPYVTAPAAAALTPEFALLRTVLAASVAFFVLTALKPFAFLGENHRYLQYSFLASFPAAALFIVSNGFWVQAAALAAFALTGVATKKVWDKMKQAEGLARDDSLLECIEFLRGRREKKIWCLSGASSMIAWFTGKRILGSGSPTMWRKYPFFVIAPETKDVPRLAKRAASEFGVQLLVASKKKCGAENAKALNMGSAKKIFENDCYYVFKLRTKND